MSYSLKREIELYINDTDSVDGAVKLAVLPEFELQLQSNLLQVFRKTISEDPEMLPRSVVDQINPVQLSFITYIKPTIGDTGITAPEELLWRSLGGKEGVIDTNYYQPQFGRINRLIPLYIFIKTTTATYKIGKAYVEQVEISFDIDYLLIAKWTLQAISFEPINNVYFTNVIDYSNLDSYIRNKFTKLTITDSSDGTEYFFPITESKILIKNILLPIFDKNIKVVTATPKDILVGGRAVTGQLSAYLSQRNKHSRDFINKIGEDLTKVNRKYKVSYIVEDKDNRIEFLFPYAIINVPNIDFDDVLSTVIEFTSAESEYGKNDDSIITYKKISSAINYYQYITALKPTIYYKCNELSGNILNYGSSGSVKNLSQSAGSTVYNQLGPYTNSKSIRLNGGSTLISTTDNPNIATLSVFLWLKPTKNINGYLFDYKSGDQIDFYLRINNNTTQINFIVGSTTFSYTTVFTNNVWHFVCINIDNITNKATIIFDNVVKGTNLSWSDTSITGNTVTFGYPANEADSVHFSEVLVFENNRSIFDNFNTIANNLYNITNTQDNFIPAYIPSTIANLPINISQTYNYYNYVKSLGPKAYWRMNDNTSTIQDHISGNYPLTGYNNPGLGFDSPLVNDNTGKSIYFGTLSNGTYQYTQSSAPIYTSGKSKFTFAFWIYIDTNSLPLNDGNYKYCFIKTNSNTGNDCLTLLSYTGTATPSISNDGTLLYNFDIGYGSGYYDCTYRFTSNIYLALKKWHFLTYTIDTSINTCKIYIDGTLKYTAVNSNIGTSINNSSIALEIGKRSYTAGRPNFKVSEFAYYEKVLSDTSIQGMYAASGVTNYNWVVNAQKGRITNSGNIPNISIGQLVFTNKNSINISGNIPVINDISYINPSKFRLFVAAYIPSIKKVNRIYTYKGSLNTTGYVLNIYKFRKINPIRQRLNINSNNILINNIIESKNSSVGIYAYSGIRLYVNIRIIYVNTQTINISSNTIVATNKVKVYKPRTGNTVIGILNTSEYSRYISNLSPQLYYKFNETEGTTLIDYSGFDRHATLYNSPTLQATGPHGPTSKAIFFNKTTLQHAIYNSAVSMPNEGTITFWMRSSGRAAYDVIFQFNYAYNAGNNINYFKYTFETTNTYWVMPYGSSWASTWQMSVSDYAWNHITITWNKTLNQISTYLNGSVITNNGAHSNWPTSLQPLGICRGNRDGVAKYFNASISNFALLNIRLSSTSVSELYNSLTSVPQYNIQYKIPSISVIPTSELKPIVPIIFI